MNNETLEAPVDFDEAELYINVYLPEKLIPLTHRCDGCNAQALHGFVISTGEDTMSTLLACSHCARTWHNAGMAYLGHKDYRTPLDEYQRRIDTEKATALKQIAAGKLDDSNFVAGTSNSLFLAQWDLQFWHKREEN